MNPGGQPPDDPRWATRGARTNPPNRFERIHLEPDPDAEPHPDDSVRVAPQTVVLEDKTSSIINYNQSPDVGFTASVNPYRGCEHGCIYCYARPFHEYLGFSAGTDFETRILAKRSAPSLLRAELLSKKWTPQVIAMSGVTDCYQPIERRLRITRGCLEVLAAFRNPVAIVTKNELVTRDIDLLHSLAAHNAAAVFVSLTTLDPELRRQLEPRGSPPRRRLETIQRLSQAGIPVGVMIAPVIPAITDHEIPNLLKAAADAGARFAGYVVLRLPLAVSGLFQSWLERFYPDRVDKVLGRIRELRGGELNVAEFGERMRGEGPRAEEIRRLFEVGARRAGISTAGPTLSASAFRRIDPAQPGLFDNL